MASQLSQSEVPPIDYALSLKNRFLNAEGGAEKREGMTQIGGTLPGSPAVTGLHELIKKNKAKVLLASTEDGRIFSLNTAQSAWSEAHTGLVQGARARSVQFDDKLIFVNGTSRNFFTDDGVAYTEQRALMEKGSLAGAVSAAGADDADISDWITNTFVAVNDLHHNITRDAFGVITAVATANVSHTSIGTAATGLGVSVSAQQVGDRYEIVDLVELNIIPTDDPANPDNVGGAGSGTTATLVNVSGVNFADTDIRVGDFVRNTTRTAIATVSAIATALTVTSITGQVAGDSLIFLKSAMPITDNIHVHFGRAYMVDSRDARKVRITGLNDPQDMSAGAGTLDASTFESGALQPVGDVIVDMTSYQRYLLMAGRSNLYFFVGTDPIADTSADAVDFAPIALFPQGIVGADSVASIGNDAVFITPDGLQAASYGQDALTLGRHNVSEQLKSDLRNALKSVPEDEIQLIHYQKRSWIMLKVGSEMYCFNYTERLGGEVRVIGDVPTQRQGSWHLFDGKLARQNAYLVRQDQSLVCGGAGGKVYEFETGAYDDDGEIYTTEYQTAWLGLDESRVKPKGSTRIKEGKYIRPVINAGQNVSYTIVAESPFDASGFESIEIQASGGATPIGLAQIGSWTIGQSPVAYAKHPLRWRGERLRLTFTTEDDKGPDILGEYTVYHNVFGVR